MSYYIYKHINDKDEVIYIGQTINLKERQDNHSSNSIWKDDIHKVEYAEVTDSLLMDIYEKYYISKYNPKYNKKDQDCKYDKFFVNLKDLEFKEYIKIKSKRTKVSNRVSYKKINFIEGFDVYYKNSIVIIERFKLEFNKNGNIIKGCACIKENIKTLFSFYCSEFSCIKNMEITKLDEEHYVYRIEYFDLNLNEFNHLKTPEQLEYKSLDELWSEIFM
jgi:hypothetical protein